MVDAVTSLPYEVVDVFTDRAFTGNPLAVVFDAQGLATDQLQAIAREFNLSETVFVLPPTEPGATYLARIFTPAAELPFAGHPSVGAAVTVVRRGLATGASVVQQCGAGLLPLAVSDGQARLTGGTPTLGPPLEPGPLLEVAGLTEADFAGPAPRAAGCGLEWPILPVRPAALPQAELDNTAARRHGLGELCMVAWDPTTRVARVRTFVPGLSVPEDPATGSAALGLGVWLVAAGLLPGDGESSYEVRQGSELQRPSRLDCTVTASGGAAVTATVTGQVVPIARGEIAVPPRDQR
jgi:trans-2,3-dihydro-3-hydroxyanthranilate isomerase